jgi:hypothetical protein
MAGIIENTTNIRNFAKLSEALNLGSTSTGALFVFKTI